MERAYIVFKQVLMGAGDVSWAIADGSIFDHDVEVPDRHRRQMRDSFCFQPVLYSVEPFTRIEGDVAPPLNAAVADPSLEGQSQVELRAVRGEIADHQTEVAWPARSEVKPAFGQHVG